MISYNNYKQLFFLDKNEKKFCQKKKIKLNPSGNPIIIQCIQDHFYLKLFSLVINQEKYNTSKVYGLISIPLKIRFIEILLIIPLLIRLFIHYGTKRKMKIMYSSIGVSEFIDHSDYNFFSTIKNLLKSISFFFKIKNKQELISFSYKGIRCGDLIYDTVVRFNNVKPSLKLMSFSCFMYFFRAINQIEFFLDVSKILKFKKAFFSQGVYIYHAIPLRVLSLLEKEIYTAGNFTQMFKLISKDDFYMMENYREYKKTMKEQKIDNIKIKKSLNKFKTRFEGEDDTGFIGFMKSNPYENYNKSLSSVLSFDGVLFLHDFYDAHKIFGEVIFNDFYEWTIYTLNIIRNNNLKIAIKPHPLQIPESLKFQKKIKSMYPDLIWLDPQISNMSIFKSGIKYGITHHGTVISELAYFKINCIYCAENPISAFNIGHFAKDKNHYKDLLLNASKLEVNKNIKSEVGKYYYLHYINKSCDYQLRSNKIDGINIKNINRFDMETKDLLK